MGALIDDHRAVYGVEPICRVLPIAPSTYHAHVARRADPAKAPPIVLHGITATPAMRYLKRRWSAEQASGLTSGRPAAKP